MNGGGFHQGEVGRRTLMSQKARRSLGGLVLLGGESSSGINFHGCVGWVAGVAPALSTLGGSLLSYLARS